MCNSIYNSVFPFFLIVLFIKNIYTFTRPKSSPSGDLGGLFLMEKQITQQNGSNDTDKICK